VRRALGPLGLLALVVVAGAGAFLLGKRAAEGPNEQVVPPAHGLPSTPDYHALYVDDDEQDRLLLGTHVGLYESRDGGVTWKTGPLGGEDVMNIVRAGGALWVARHNVLERSRDGGRTWAAVRPDGLPSLDVHGFAPAAGGRLYAAVSGEGLYVSNDGGETFDAVTDEVGAGVYGLLALPGRTLLAAEPSHGVLLSTDGGESWKNVLPAPAIRLAAVGDVLLATGERIWRSSDNGRTWRPGFEPGPAFEPIVASGNLVFAITPHTRTLYRSDDGGEDWAPVAQDQG
jgi:photosystem II stability/assembly factor-like uncharacterized protein